MTLVYLKSRQPHAACRRLAALAPLDETALVRLEHAAQTRSRRTQAHRDLILEGQPQREPILILSGWACRTRLLSDGRRQIISFLLPGDLVGVPRHRDNAAPTTIHTLTEMIDCAAPIPGADASDAGLAECYALSAALDDFNLFRQITRLGRLDAYERVADLLLELYERLQAVDLAAAGSFPLPLTQETIADALGLTSVHVNRTLKALRHDQALTLRGGSAVLHDVKRLSELVDHRHLSVALG